MMMAQARSALKGFAVVLILIIGFLIYFTEFLVSDWLLGTSSLPPESAQGTIGLTVQSTIGVSEPPAFPRSIDVTIRELQVDESLEDEFTSAQKQLCIEWIDVNYGATIGDAAPMTGVVSIPPTVDGVAVCIPMSDDRVLALNRRVSIATASLFGSSFFRFPLDGVRITIDVALRGVEVTSNGGRTPSTWTPHFRADVSASTWSVDAESTMQSDRNAISVHFERPLLTILAPFIVLLVVLLAICGIIRENDPRSATEIAIGVMFGTFAARQVVLPEGAPGMTAFDFALLVEQVGIVFALTLTFWEARSGRSAE